MPAKTEVPGKLKLYAYFRSSASYRARIALNLKGVPYEILPIHLLKDGGEQRTPEYKRLNPMAQVPALVFPDGRVISQSTAILEYLEERYPKPALMPQDPWERAKVREIAQLINSGIQPLQNIGVTQELTRLYGAGERAVFEWNAHWIRKGFDGLEPLLRTTAGSYCVGSQLSLAECFLIPQVFNARRFEIDLSRYPTIARIDALCRTQKAFQDAAPEKQPDAPR